MTINDALTRPYWRMFLAKLTKGGTQINVLERVAKIGATDIETRDIYSATSRIHGEFDSIVTACGGTANNFLYNALEGSDFETHILGDAYAPRRISFATQQAYHLAAQL